MADIPVVKELQENIQRNAKEIDQIQAEMQVQFRRACNTPNLVFYYILLIDVI
jgi:hypothetical protein